MDQHILDEQMTYYRTMAQEYDETTGQTDELLFFANWVSHVPTPRLAAFLGTVARAVRPGGSLAMVDQYAPMPEDRAIIVRDAQEGAIYAKRSLRNGQTFLIVKVFYDLQLLEHLLEALDFTVTVQKLDDIFFFLQAWRKAS